MKAFSFSSASGIPECDAAEPILVIQTPAETSVNLTVNGVDIHVESLVSFQQVHRNALSMSVHRGSATTAFGNTFWRETLSSASWRAQETARPRSWIGAAPCPFLTLNWRVVKECRKP